MHDTEAIVPASVDCAVRIHKRLGPGLFESVYEALLAEGLRKRGFAVERQKIIGARIDDIILTDAFRLDLLVEGILPIELKAVESLAPVHTKQLLTYLRLMDLPLGLLLNFGGETMKSGGMRRVANKLCAFPSS